jgi:hypothetical protein
LGNRPKKSQRPNFDGMTGGFSQLLNHYFS